jgi:hypothetical protein
VPTTSIPDTLPAGVADGATARGRVSFCALARAERTLSSSRQIARRVEVTLSVEQAHLALSWYFALEALIDKPPLGPIHLLAHASCLGELEARIVGCLCCARAPAARYTHLGGLCGMTKAVIVPTANIVSLMTCFIFSSVNSRGAMRLCRALCCFASLSRRLAGTRWFCPPSA